MEWSNNWMWSSFSSLANDPNSWVTTAVDLSLRLKQVCFSSQLERAKSASKDSYSRPALATSSFAEAWSALTVHSVPNTALSQYPDQFNICWASRLFASPCTYHVKDIFWCCLCCWVHLIGSALNYVDNCSAAWSLTD